MRVYDPRDNTWKESDNPALIALFLILTHCKPLPDFAWRYIWTNSIIWANFCDEEIEISEPKTN